jgi:hypothetical protein
MSKKIEAFWENATADDVVRVMRGETVEARFRDDEKSAWFISSLAGWTAGMIQWYSIDNDYWTHCQVYREPSWYANKPDPGPGFRLLEKFPDEELQSGDECFASTGKWDQSYKATIGERQSYGMWYRRRIEPVEPKFAVGQMVRVVGPKEKPALHWGKEMDCQIGFTGVIRNDPLYEDAERFYNLEGIGIWCFREDYLEAVEPVESKPVLIRRRVVEIGDEFKLPNGSVLVFNGEGFEVAQ